MGRQDPGTPPNLGPGRSVRSPSRPLGPQNIRNNHNSPARALGGSEVVTGSEDKTARVWDVAMGTTIKVLEGHTLWVSAAAVSPDGKTATTRSDNEVLMWDLASGEQLSTPPPSARIITVPLVQDRRIMQNGGGEVVSFVGCTTDVVGKELATVKIVVWVQIQGSCCVALV